MIIFKEPGKITRFLGQKSAGKIDYAFVPTMGALHSGHLALIKKARQESELVVCSIFVNPTQFNDPKDFERYPQTIEQDIFMLEKAGCDILFMPSVAAMYPNGLAQTKLFDLGSVETVLEGKYRPGHFQGVCQVVNRLLEIVKPAKLYMGQKDFQQCMVIKKLIELTAIKTALIIFPTQREPGGLALSSRNMRLSESEREKAAALYQTLSFIKNNLSNRHITDLKKEAVETLSGKDFKVDYVEIARVSDLKTANDEDKNVPLVALVAAYLNEVRLIDNLLL